MRLFYSMDLSIKLTKLETVFFYQLHNTFFLKNYKKKIGPNNEKIKPLTLYFSKSPKKGLINL